MAAHNSNGKGRGKGRKRPAVYYVPCSVRPGMFRGEYLVTFDALSTDNPDKKVSVQLLADEHEVIVQSGTPDREQPAEGLLRVEVLDRGKGLALLVLPQPAQPMGERVYVEEDLVQEGAGT
jgi:hypothetical protein